MLSKQRRPQKYDIQALRQPGVQENLKTELDKLCQENDPSQEITANNIWSQLKRNTIAATETVIGRQKKVKSKPWMTDEILALMADRRIVKNQQDKYNEINRSIKRKILEAKEKWTQEKCEEAERLHQLHDSFNFHRKIKEITGENKSNTLTSIKNRQGTTILDINELNDTWKNYAEALFWDQRTHNPANNFGNMEGPKNLESEVRYSIDCLKNGKSPGHDDIYAEVLKQTDIKQLTYLFNVIYDSGQIPQDWLKSTFIAIPKKTNPKNCGDHRLISLMSHALKAFLRVIHSRIYRKCEEMSGDTQFGFIKGLGTREALFSVKLLVQKCYDQRQDVFICFIDYQRAFDNVKHEPLMERLQEIGVDGKDIRIIKELYWQQSAEIRIDGDRTTETFSVLKGVRQGCVLSPILFNIYVEKIFQMALESETRGIKVNGIPINNIRYADDTAILANNLEDLQILLNKLNECGEQFGLHINVAKTKMMVISRHQYNTHLNINGENIERVTNFTYLGASLNELWDCDEEVKRRIGRAKTTFFKLKNLLLHRNMPLHTRIRVIQSYVWPVMLYGAETWSLKVKSINRIEAFEMWTLRRLLRIPWTEHATNDEVLRRARVDRQLMDTVKQRKVSYLGHILRGRQYSIPRLILQGKIEGRRGPGRKQHSWLRNIRNWSGIPDAATIFRRAEEGTLVIL